MGLLEEFIEKREAVRIAYLDEIKRFTILFSNTNPAPDRFCQDVIKNQHLETIAGVDSVMEAWPAIELMKQCIQIGYEAGRDPWKYAEWEKTIAKYAEELEDLDGVIHRLQRRAP